MDKVQRADLKNAKPKISFKIFEREEKNYDARVRKCSVLITRIRGSVANLTKGSLMMTSRYQGKGAKVL